MRYLNLALLIAFPLSWFAPLMRAGWNLPLFGLKEVSVVSGLQALWDHRCAAGPSGHFLRHFRPPSEVLGVALIQFGLMRRKVLPVLNWLGKLAMADVFLIALYIVIIKGVGMAKIETAWGLYAFTACILTSLLISHLTAKRG